MTKSELRKEFLAKRSELSQLDAESMSVSVVNRYFASVNVASIRNLHCYLPIEKFNEPNTKLIFERVWTEFPTQRTAVPRIDFATRELQSVIYSSSCPIIKNKWGVNEPEGGTVVHPEALDAAIVPLLCIDKNGSRVGYGKGFYDRFLAKCRQDCLKVGLGFFAPVDLIDDVNEFDIPLDLCVTPDEVFTFK